MSNFDVQFYLDTLGIKAPTTVSLSFLSKLQREHLYTIPFENLDIQRKVPIQLDLAHLFEKIILRGRGGFCYELNGLLHGLLQALGFNSRLISARVYDSPRQYSPAYDHMAIVVQLEDELYLVDIGFGDFAERPILIADGTTSSDGTRTYNVDRYYSYWRVNQLQEGKAIPEYIFKTTPEAWRNFEARSRFHQLDPQSHFQKGPVITRLSPWGRMTLTHQKWKLGERVRPLQSKGDFARLLRGYFVIDWEL